MRPLMLFGVIYIVFAEMLKVGGDQPFFGAALLLGIVLFQFFTDSTAAAVRSLIVRENLVRKIEFPRIAVPLACVLQASLNLGLNLIPVAIFLFASGGSVSLTWLELPLILLLLVVFTTGASLLLAALFVRYRDVEPIWDVVLQALFYATPILYSLTIVIDKAGIEAARLHARQPDRDRDPAGAPCADRPVVRERRADLRHPGRRPDPDRLRRGDVRRGDDRLRARRAARRRGPLGLLGVEDVPAQHEERDACRGSRTEDVHDLLVDAQS